MQVDLGSATEFRSMELYPAEPITGPETRDGVTVSSSGWGIDKQFGFPEAIRVEAANDPLFDDSRVLADMTLNDASIDDERTEPLVVDVGPAAARYVRVVATEPWVFDPTGGRVADLDARQGIRPWSAFALVALAVRGGEGIGLAVDRPVRASSSAESEAWGRDRLVDGIYESRFASESPQLRTEVDLSGTIQRA